MTRRQQVETYCLDVILRLRYVEDKFNEVLQSQLINENYFSIFHLHVRSLQNKLDDLTALLANLDVKFYFLLLGC